MHSGGAFLISNLPPQLPNFTVFLERREKLCPNVMEGGCEGSGGRRCVGMEEEDVQLWEDVWHLLALHYFHGCYGGICRTCCLPVHACVRESAEMCFPSPAFDLSSFQVQPATAFTSHNLLSCAPIHTGCLCPASSIPAALCIGITNV